MESEKNKNLFRDIGIELESEFIEFRPEAVIIPDNDSKKPNIIREMSDSAERFQLPGNIWEVMTSDQEMKVELESMVESKVAERLRRRLEQDNEDIREDIKIKAKEQGYREGVELGFEEGKKHSENMAVRLNGICGQILDSHKSIIAGHEEIWSRALLYLLKRFMVSREEEIVSRVKRWLKENLEEISLRAKLKVFLSVDDYEKMEKYLVPGPEDQWAWRKDIEMKSGEIRCESDLGGVIFSPFEEIRALEEIIGRYSEGKKADA